MEGSLVITVAASTPQDAKRTRGSRTRRSRRKETTPFSIPIEVLAIVCTYFQRTPRHIFLLMKACKGLRTQLTSEWWERFWAVHKATVLDRQQQLRHHYLNEIVHGPNLRPSQFAHILRLVYSLRCERCGARWNHHVVGLLRLRLCESCLRDNLVSNRVLYYRYGLAVADILDEHAHLITYFPMTSYHRRDASFRELSADPIDIAGFGPDGGLRQELLFLWRPDVARLYDLEAHYRHQLQRLDGINRIKACVRRRRIWAAIRDALYGKRRPRCIAHAVLSTAAHELPINVPPAGHVVGGPICLSSAIRPYNVRRIIACNESVRHSFIFEKMQLCTPRPLLGFNEVCSKTGLEKFGARSELPPLPEAERPFMLYGLWRMPLNVYSVRTGELLFNGCREQDAEIKGYPPRFVRYPPPPSIPPPPAPPAKAFRASTTGDDRAIVVVVIDDDDD